MLMKQRGSILIEGLISVLIFSVGVLALIGMQAVAIKNAAQAQYRNDAGLLASQILSQIQVDQNNITNYATDQGSYAPKDAWLEHVANTLPNGNAVITYVDTAASPRLITITLNWRAPNEPSTDTHQYLISASVMPAEN